MAEIREYGPNSNKSREREHEEIAERKVEKVVLSSPASVKKKSKLSKFKDSIVKEDAHNVGSWMLTEMFIPKLIDMFVDMLKGGLDMYFYGESRSDGRRRSSGSKVSYRDYYDDDRRGRRARPRDYGEYYDYDEIEFDNRRDAEAVLDGMLDILENPKYDKVVRVGDYFDLADVPGRYTDYKYGWTDLRGAYVRRVGKSYVIELPRPMAID